MLMAAFGVGLFNGFLHCSGMCGPFVLSFSLAIPSNHGRRQHLGSVLAWYNAGRLTGFAGLGAIFGLVGSFVNLAARSAGIDAISGMVGGALMMVWAIGQMRPNHPSSPLQGWSISAVRPLARWLKSYQGPKSALSSFSSGLLLSAHPCGLIFAMLLTASATGSGWRGGLALAVFGIGTMPAMVSIALAGYLGRQRITGRWAKYVTAAVIGLSGILFALRGLSVNGLIPALNPWLF
jgi:sulfite exporter TauE/SafE